MLKNKLMQIQKQIEEKTEQQWFNKKPVYRDLDEK